MNEIIELSEEPKLQNWTQTSPKTSTEDPTEQTPILMMVKLKSSEADGRITLHFGNPLKLPDNFIQLVESSKRSLDGDSE